MPVGLLIFRIRIIFPKKFNLISMRIGRVWHYWGIAPVAKYTGNKQSLKFHSTLCPRIRTFVGILKWKTVWFSMVHLKMILKDLLSNCLWLLIKQVCYERNLFVFLIFPPSVQNPFAFCFPPKSHKFDKNKIFPETID